MAYHAARSAGVYTYACKYLRRNPSVENMWDNFKIFFVLGYNKLREEYNLNATQVGFQKANHAAEEQHNFASALDNLALAYF